ncbi:MAG: trypsin-like peptidase domain-containing protein [Clostridia bacterium]|nr:trypsin-like peptidase domain-containing protein [Clostridia bacterium]
MFENENRENEQNNDIDSEKNDVNNPAENRNEPVIAEQKIVLSPDVVNVDVVRKKKEPDKKQYLVFAVIACLICALVGGITGGIVSSVVMKNDNKDETTQSVQEGQLAVTPQTEKQPETTENQTVNNVVSETTTKKKENYVIQSGIFTSSDDKPSLEFIFNASEIYEYNVDSVVSIEVKNSYLTGYGTGFIISEEGYIVTNYHVVEGASTIKVTLYDESVYTAKLIGYEESNDLAVIKIEPQGKIESLVYGKSSDLKVGDDVYVIGNPLGDLTFTLTTGVVSALNRLIDTGTGFNINMFQTDAAINSGNSGGPVFDKHGFVVGIASAKYASASIEGLSFCVPIDDVRSMIDEIINKGYVSGKPLMGVSVYDKEIMSFGFLQSQRSINGAKIAAIGDNSAASRAGLQVGDIIVAADDKTIKTVSQLRTVLSDFRSGNAITLKINRNGTLSDVVLVLDEYAPAQPRTNYSNVYDL